MMLNPQLLKQLCAISRLRLGDESQKIPRKIPPRRWRRLQQHTISVGDISCDRVVVNNFVDYYMHCKLFVVFILRWTVGLRVDCANVSRLFASSTGAAVGAVGDMRQPLLYRVDLGLSRLGPLGLVVGILRVFLSGPAELDNGAIKVYLNWLTGFDADITIKYRT